MTENTKAGATGQAAALPVDQPEYQFTPFAWVKGGGEMMNFVGLTRDVSGGVKTVLQVLERDLLENGFGDASPIFSPVHAGTLTRFVIASLDLLEAEAERIQEKAQPSAVES